MIHAVNHFTPRSSASVANGSINVSKTRSITVSIQAACLRFPTVTRKRTISSPAGTNRSYKLNATASARPRETERQRPTPRTQPHKVLEYTITSYPVTAGKRQAHTASRSLHKRFRQRSLHKRFRHEQLLCARRSSSETRRLLRAQDWVRTVCTAPTARTRTTKRRTLRAFKSNRPTGRAVIHAVNHFTPRSSASVANGSINVSKTRSITVSIQAACLRFPTVTRKRTISSPAGTNRSYKLNATASARPRETERQRPTPRTQPHKVLEYTITSYPVTAGKRQAHTASRSLHKRFRQRSLHKRFRHEQLLCARRSSSETRRLLRAQDWVRTVCTAP